MRTSNNILLKNFLIHASKREEGTSTGTLQNWETLHTHTSVLRQALLQLHPLGSSNRRRRRIKQKHSLRDMVVCGNCAFCLALSPKHSHTHRTATSAQHGGSSPSSAYLPQTLVWIQGVEAGGGGPDRWALLPLLSSPPTMPPPHTLPALLALRRAFPALHALRLGEKLLPPLFPP